MDHVATPHAEVAPPPSSTKMSFDVFKKPSVMTLLVVAVVAGIFVPMFHNDSEINQAQYRELIAQARETGSSCEGYGDMLKSSMKDGRVSNAEYRGLSQASGPCTRAQLLGSLGSIVDAK